MNLVVHIPVTWGEEETYIQTLARRAPSFTVEGSIWIAIFTRLPEAIDLALQLVGESVRVPDAWASMNGRRMSSLLRLWTRLECYRESLDAPSPEIHCFRKAAKHSLLVECLNPSCPVPCQFVCAPCRIETGSSWMSPDHSRLQQLVIEAEVEWCPNLKLAGVKASTT